MIKDSTGRPEARAPARAYARRAREEASSPDVITGTFSLYDTTVIALIDPGSTHSYVWVNLVSSKSLPVELTEARDAFRYFVTNPRQRLNALLATLFAVYRYSCISCRDNRLSCVHRFSQGRPLRRSLSNLGKTVRRSALLVFYFAEGYAVFCQKPCFCLEN